MIEIEDNGSPHGVACCCSTCEQARQIFDGAYHEAMINFSTGLEKLRDCRHYAAAVVAVKFKFGKVEPKPGELGVIPETPEETYEKAYAGAMDSLPGEDVPKKEWRAVAHRSACNAVARAAKEKI